MKSLLFLLLALPAHAQLLGVVETYTLEDNADSWNLYNYATEQTTAPFYLLPGSNDEEIYGEFQDDEGISLFANEMSSDQFFIGDYTSAGIAEVELDVYVEDLTTFDELEIYILAGGVFYYSNPFELDQAGWSIVSNTFRNDQWYLFNDNTRKFIPVEITDAILGEIEEVGVTFYPTSAAADTKRVAIDNFTLLPDRTPIDLDFEFNTQAEKLWVSFFGREGVEFTLQISKNLKEGDWERVDDAFEAGGYFERRFDLKKKRFFRLLLRPFYRPL